MVCKNGTLHMFSPKDRGQRLFPPIQLPSPVSKLAFQGDQLALITSCGHLFIWSLDPRPKVKMAKENVQSLFQDGKDCVARILLNKEDRIIIITSSGRSFTFDQSLGSWLCLSDTSSSIQSCSSYATAATNLPAETANLPLASLGKKMDYFFTRNFCTDFLNFQATLPQVIQAAYKAQCLKRPKLLPR